tara:strand:+ start:14541 stop:15701 length:1161 start_codon:yes stop_codon:yes gene_type:complete
MIPYSKQNLNKKDISAVLKILKSNFLTQGPTVEKFEKKICEITKAKYATACNNGSSALHLACLALNVKKNDIVWTVPNTFVATANCVLNCGGKIDFVDIDKENFNISVTELEKKLIIAKKKKKLPKILIPVHLGGLPTEQKKLWLLSKKYKFKIIEDASHSIGAKHLNEPVGSCKWSHITTFSFHPVKVITTIEGGAALTNDKKLSEKMKLYLSNGITKNHKNFKNKKMKNCPWYYEQQERGYNYRMSDVCAALGISQLSRLKKFISERNKIANIYKRLLKDLPLKFQDISKGNLSTYHLLIVQFNLKKSKFNYKKIFNKLRSANFFVNLHYMPMHINPFFKKKGFKKKQFPVAEKYGECSLSLPVYYGIPIKKILQICRKIKSFF